MYEPLVPATLVFSGSGTPYSSQYDDIYHSEHGGPGQARHVFLAGNHLPARWRGRENFVIVETGFGTGLNFLATWQAWQGDGHACRRLHYISVEKHPFRAEDLAAIHARWPEFAELSARLQASWPILTPGFHRLEFADGRLILTLLLGDAGRILPKLQAKADAIYLDGFAPGKNPELWSPEILKRIGRLANDGATLATWSVSSSVRDALQQAGCALEKVPGFAGKREMLTGRFGTGDDKPATPERRAIVIGAGIAGCTACERLASRGWEVTLIDRQDGPAMAASGNLAGILMPMVSKDDNIAARLSRTALLYGLRHWTKPSTMAAGSRLGLTGVFQIAREPAQERLQIDIVDRLGFPEGFLAYVNQGDARTRLGHDVAAGGWLFEHAGWANPPSLCQASLKLAGNRLTTMFGRSVSKLRRCGEQWQVLDDTDNPLVEAPTLILANGSEARRLEPQLPIRRVRGQVSLVRQGSIPPLRMALCRDGYAAPAIDGLHAVGASYDLDDDCNPRRESTLGNMARLANLMPGVPQDIESAVQAERVGFRPVLPDRLPLMGEIPDWSIFPKRTDAQLKDIPRQQGLYGLLGYASRGLVWAQLLAEALVCQLEAEPMPMATDLLAAIDPARFALREIRRTGSCK